MFRKLFYMFLLVVSTSSVVLLYTKSLAHFLLLIIGLFLYVACADNCRGRESMWIFILNSFALVPANIYMSWVLFPYTGLVMDGPVGRIVASILLFIALFCVEQIAVGIIGRVIWRSQIGDELFGR